MQPNPPNYPPSRYDEGAGQTVPAQPVPPTQMGYPPNSPAAAQPMPYPLPTPPRRSIPIACLGCGLILFSFVVSILCGGAVLLYATINSFGEQIVGRLEEVLPKQDQAFQTTRIFDRNGAELYQIFDEGRRTKVKLADISPNLIAATIAVEDGDFYENPGVDVQAILRAGLQYFSGTEAGGASTITQQLVRNIAFEYAYRTERSARRKIEEIFMAVALTQRKTKDEILEMYLNVIYYGNLAYGAEAAAQTYFGKPAKDLTLAEAALLAGLPQQPARLDPFNPDPVVQQEVLDRRDVVLRLMVEKNKITTAEAAAARAQPLIYANPNVSLRSPHFTLYASDELKTLIEALNLPPAYVKFGGLAVYTTLDPRIQSLAENAAKNQIALIKDRNNAGNAAVVALKPATGEILAMVGSVDYRDDSIDGRVNVVTAQRQPGSAIKPLTYAAAMERGFSAATVLWDVETHIAIPGSGVYSPKNYDNAFHGPVRVRDALANSYNIPAVSTLRQIGVDALLKFAARVGVRSFGDDPTRFGPSLTLGGGELTPLELAQAYAVFANQGNFVPVTSILCIVNSEGEIVYQYEDGCAGRPNARMVEKSINALAAGKAVLDPRIAFVISDILADNAARSPAMGSRSPLRTDGIISSVKTGTTNNYRDNWTVGYTRNVVVGVWVGNTKGEPMRGTTGLTGAAPIWNEVMTGLYNTPSLQESLRVRGNLLSDELTPPDGLRRQQICQLASLRDPVADCTMGRAEWVLDSPPLIPDVNAGGALRPSTDPRFVPTPAPTNGPVIQYIDPGVVKTLVQPLDPAAAAGLVANVRSPVGAVMPAPRYCLVPQEAAGALPGVALQAFIAAPALEDELIYAVAYAQANGLAIAPTLVCRPDMAFGGGLSVPNVTTAILWPAPGETVTGRVFVKGTAAWPVGVATYFKMELQGPQFPEWTTFSGPTETPVINGDLGSFGAAGLVPGTYQLRIVVVGIDGNYLQLSTPIPVNITGQ